jgi:protein arginine kinase activator
MNCEKCKNKKATLFYADDDGVKHALCASCGAASGRVASFAAANSVGGAIYLPEPTLLTMQMRGTLQLAEVADEEQIFCKGCGTHLSELKDAEGVVCPECYAVFADSIFPSPLLSSDSTNIKMPRARRERLHKRRAIDEARAELKAAIASESFELAATLRDKIKRLEKHSQ